MKSLLISSRFCQFYMILVHFGILFYAIMPQIHKNATGNCYDCADEKKVVVNINLGKNVFCKEWKYIDNKFQVVTQSKCIGELLESLESEWDIIVLTHINVKEIQSAQ